MNDVKRLIQEIRKRCDKATPGPWRIIVSRNRPHIFPSELSQSGVYSLARVENNEVGERHGNAEFLAHARTDLPAVLDLLEKAIEMAEFVIDERMERSYIHGTDAERARSFLESAQDWAGGKND